MGRTPPGISLSSTRCRGRKNDENQDVVTFWKVSRILSNKAGYLGGVEVIEVNVGNIVELSHPIWTRTYTAKVIKDSDYDTIIVRLDTGDVAKVCRSNVSKIINE